MSSGEDRPAVLLADTLEHALLIHRLQEILFFAREQRQSDGLRLLELAHELWGSDDQTAHAQRFNCSNSPQLHVASRAIIRSFLIGCTSWLAQLPV